MPSIASRVSKIIQSNSVNPVSGFPASIVESPGFSLDRYVSKIAITRGIPPEQFMYNSDLYRFFPDKPTFKRGFSIATSINNNLALIGSK